MKREYRYGVKIKDLCRQHEQSVMSALEKEMTQSARESLIREHEKMLAWLMHERLIHLIVTFMTVILVMFAMVLIVFLPESVMFSFPLFVITFILLIFYIRHYFFLENTVQYWYILDGKLTQNQTVDP